MDMRGSFFDSETGVVRVEVPVLTDEDADVRDRQHPLAHQFDQARLAGFLVLVE